MYRCQCMFDFFKLEHGMMFGVDFSSVILEKNDWRCLWDVWILEVQSPQWKAALIAMALFLEAWQHVVQWYWWMSVLLCIARFIQPMKCWSASPLLPDPWCVLHHARKVGLYWNLLSCVVALQPEEYCYFVKGGQTAREESALGRPHGMVLQTMPHYRCDVHSSASGFIHLDFDDLAWCYYVICYWWFIQRPFWLPKDLLNLCVCHTWKQSRNFVPFKTPYTEGHWRRAQMAEWQLNDVLLRAPWKRSERAILPTFNVLDFQIASQTYVDWINSGLMYVLGANITSPLKGGGGHSFCSSNKSK